MSNSSVENSVPPASLPWPSGVTPLMLAPMQGVTNRATRSLFIDRWRPDVVFSEFMRVSAVGRKRLSKSDARDIAADEAGVPLVVQLVGNDPKALASAATIVESGGARHINLNLGCPYGRMTTSATGGKLLQHPQVLATIIPQLRQVISGSFSVKLRAGYDDPQQIFSLLPLFEESGVDFLVLHPRTVVQEYQGIADHAVTAQVVRRTRLPVIANGDIRCAEQGLRILHETGATGLMLGRGAISDPLLFERLRGRLSGSPARQERSVFLKSYLQDLLERYQALFCGEAQILSKIKGVVLFMQDPAFDRQFMQMRRAKDLQAFRQLVDELG